MRLVTGVTHGESIDHPLASSTVHRLLARKGSFDRVPPTGGVDRQSFALENAGGFDDVRQSTKRRGAKENIRGNRIHLTQ